MMPELCIAIATKLGRAWADEQITAHHYLHKPVDPRSSPLIYLLFLENQPVGCLVFSRPECTRVKGWYGSLPDLAGGWCRLSYWQVLNLSRVWLSPAIQVGGAHYLPNAASQAIGRVLAEIQFDYLLYKPPVWMGEPYEIKEVLSYCDSQVHTGALYKACNFQVNRASKKGLVTFRKALRRTLTKAERDAIRQRSERDTRCRHLRAKRAQLSLFGEEVSA